MIKSKNTCQIIKINRNQWWKTREWTWSFDILWNPTSFRKAFTLGIFFLLEKPLLEKQICRGNTSENFVSRKRHFVSMNRNSHLFFILSSIDHFYFLFSLWKLSSLCEVSRVIHEYNLFIVRQYKTQFRFQWFDFHPLAQWMNRTELKNCAASLLR